MDTGSIAFILICAALAFFDDACTSTFFMEGLDAEKMC